MKGKEPGNNLFMVLVSGVYVWRMKNEMNQDDRRGRKGGNAQKQIKGQIKESWKEQEEEMGRKGT